MSRLARAATSLYCLAFLWLGYLTSRTWGTVPVWVSLLTAAAALVCVIAAVRESEHADALEDLRDQIERATSPGLRPPGDTQLTLAEEQAFAEIETNYRKST
jgi:HAMP domain-containing protein